jgi:hypothetical protein
MNLGGDDSNYDPMDDKKPRAGQILWIRGLTRLQTQVSVDLQMKAFFYKNNTSFSKKDIENFPIFMILFFIFDFLFL